MSRKTRWRWLCTLHACILARCNSFRATTANLLRQTSSSPCNATCSSKRTVSHEFESTKTDCWPLRLATSKMIRFSPAPGIELAQRLQKSRGACLLHGLQLQCHLHCLENERVEAQLLSRLRLLTERFHLELNLLAQGHQVQATVEPVHQDAVRLRNVASKDGRAHLAAEP
eukprot:9150260-Pyramimonas_sp.AAC.1